MSVRNFVAELLVSMKANFDPTQISAYTVRPKMISDKERISDDSGGDTDSGLLEFKNANMVPSIVNQAYENRHYTVIAKFSMYAQPAQTSFNETISEFKSVIDIDLTDVAGRTYALEMKILDWPNNKINPKCLIEITGIEEMVLKV
jgi:hypothetical protein